MQTETTSNKIQTADDVSGGSTDGWQGGQATGSYIAFYGTVPVQRGAGIAQLTDTSGGTAAAGTGLQALTSTYNSTLIANGLSTLATAVNQAYTLLHALGLQSN
jgi:hypothetical protein